MPAQPAPECFCRGTGIQNYLIELDSRLRGNDEIAVSR
jgi:hypothetical protein